MQPFIDLGVFSVRAFTALVGGAVLLSLAALAFAARRAGERPLAWVDAGLGALLGGVIGARALHVLLTLAYFEDHVGEAFSLRAGGLSWHGALFGGLLGAWLVTRWRRLPFGPVADALALAWPLGVIAVWAGCRVSACGYGAEVWTLAAYPEWMVSEAPDVFGVVVPRYNAGQFGLGLGAALLGLMVVLTLAGWLRGCRLWLVLLLTGAGMFVIGFFRGDGAPSPLPNLTWDQALDLSAIALGVVGMVGTVLRWVKVPDEGSGLDAHMESGSR